MFTQQKYLPAIIMIGLILLIPLFVQWVEVAGSVIHDGDIFSDYYIGFVTAIIIGISISIWPVPNQDKLPLFNVWVVKSLVVLGGMLVYEYHYGQIGLDAFNYYAESRHGEFRAEDFIQGAGTANIINLARLYQVYLPDSYHAMKVIWALIGFLGVYLIYTAAKKVYLNCDVKVFYVLSFFPSILFWTSILGKDPINFIGIAIYIVGVVGFYADRRLHYIILIAFGIYIASYIRFWYGLILTIPLIPYFLLFPLPLLNRFLIIAASAVGVYFTSQELFSGFNIGSLADLILTSDSISHSWADRGGSGQTIEGGLNSLDATMKFIPLGAFTALFRPFPGEVLNLFGTLSGFENLIIFILTILAFMRTRFSELQHPILIWAISLIVVWALFYSIASYQNMGAAVRFRLQILPVLLMVVLYLSRKRV